MPVTIRLQGESMRPLIRKGRDRVTIVPVKRSLKVGDIVLFRSGDGRYVVHRVCALRTDMVCTLGDNCSFNDGWIPREDVWGLVVKMERNGRTCVLDSKWSRAFGRLWMATLPLRRIYRRVRWLAAKVYHLIFGQKESKGT